jgi:phosphoribosylglycinamide formyltransferase-1
MGKKIALFASGSGTNAEKIVEYFKERSDVEVVALVVSRKDAGVIERAKHWGVDIKILNKAEYTKTSELLDWLNTKGVDLIVLAGFLWLIPSYLVVGFKDRIVNIHPALLPKYGGKGMYGMNVHEAVAKNKEDFSGITIHYVDEIYDNGKIIFQASCDVKDCSPNEIAKKVQQLEHKHFPRIVDEILTDA